MSTLDERLASIYEGERITVWLPDALRRRMIDEIERMNAEMIASPMWLDPEDLFTTDDIEHFLISCAVEGMESREAAVGLSYCEWSGKQLPAQLKEEKRTWAQNGRRWLRHFGVQRGETT